jgi:hypothetical protein
MQRDWNSLVAIIRRLDVGLKLMIETLRVGDELKEGTARPRLARSDHGRCQPNGVARSRQLTIIRLKTCRWRSLTIGRPGIMWSHAMRCSRQRPKQAPQTAATVVLFSHLFGDCAWWSSWTVLLLNLTGPASRRPYFVLTTASSRPSQPQSTVDWPDERMS